MDLGLSMNSQVLFKCVHEVVNDMSLGLCLCSELVIVSGFPLIIMSAHAQYRVCTCSVKGFQGLPSLACRVNMVALYTKTFISRVKVVQQQKKKMHNL